MISIIQIGFLCPVDAINPRGRAGGRRVGGRGRRRGLEAKELHCNPTAINAGCRVAVEGRGRRREVDRKK